MNPMIFAPLAAQGIFTVSTIPAFVRLYKVKKSEEHSIYHRSLTVVGHLILLPWNLLYVREITAVVATLVALFLALAFVGQIIYYRRYPGGYQ